MTRQLPLLLLLAASCRPAEIVWTRMTGQMPVEAAPLVADFDRNGEKEILLLNRAGQLMLWKLDGTPAGSGQDGTIAQLPKGRWTSTPSLIPSPMGARVLTVSVEGLVIALDTSFKILWSHQLPGETLWGKTMPALLDTGAGKLACYGDVSGTLTCLEANGRVAWTRKFAERPFRTPPQSTGARLIVPAGVTLYALDATGKVEWQRDLKSTILTRPEQLALPAGPAIVCGDESGRLHALRLTGEPMWQASIGRPMETFLNLLPRPDSTPLILTTGHWGNLYAIDAAGRIAWTYFYRSRSRAPRVVDAGPGAAPQIALGTFAQRLFQIDNSGRRLDNVRLGGLIASIPEPLARGAQGRSDVLVVTASLLAYRVRFNDGPPTPAEAPAAEPEVLASTGADLRVWPTPPYATFDAKRVAPNKMELESANEVRVDNLYLGEADQGAFIVASRLNAPMRVRVTSETPVDGGKTLFAGAIVLREVVETGTVNGEPAADALPALGDAGLVTVPAGGAVKIWVSVDARSARPGTYAGKIRVTPLDKRIGAIELALKLDIPNLAMPAEMPLKLCTWDYVPNKMFPGRTREVLDDMTRHGVNVFPRSTAMPNGTVDAEGRLTMDWTPLDKELDLLAGRGIILFQFLHPPIRFAAGISAEAQRRAEIAYLHAFRDRLKSRGRGYADYAFYPIDEPGLDYGPNTANLVDAGRLYREADPLFRIYTDPVPGLSWKDFERIAPYVDIWAPSMRLVSGLASGDPRIKSIMSSGKTLWSYECVSQVKSLSPLRYNRANAWRAKFFGLAGLGFWTHSTIEYDPWLAGKGINDEYALVYPGELPVPSVRWEAVRDGMEDVAAIALLEQRMEAHRRAGTKAEVVAQAGAALRRALQDIADLADEAFIESRDFLAAGDRRIWHSWADVKRYRRHRAMIARFTLALQ
jgi:outer membrane protein assembly factor BamB